MKYTILREGPDGFQPTGEVFDAGDVSDEDANKASTEYVDQLQKENGGCYAAQIVRE